MRKITGKILTYDTEFNGILKDGKNIYNVPNVIYNETVAKEQEKIFLEDQLKSKLVIKEEYYKRSKNVKIQESLIRLLAPIL